MQQIADWLEKLGMSEYAHCFAENRIDFSVLPDLTDQDLEKLGVVLGDRHKMLRAIAAMAGVLAPGAPPAAVTTYVTRQPAAVSATAEATGERRYVTVMFCDLVGSTSISAQLDAEEWRDLISAYLDAASTAVTELGGHVGKKLGDGLMVLFGYPTSQENDAERAARAALSIQRALVEVNRKNASAGKPALNARIGIETGPVVVDAAGEIYGDAPNIAARLQALAEPGTVVVTTRVQHQVAGLFVVEEGGSHELKGLSEPVTLFRLVRASGGGRRAFGPGFRLRHEEQNSRRYLFALQQAGFNQPLDGVVTDAAYSRSFVQTHSLRIVQSSFLTSNRMVTPGCRYTGLIPPLPFARGIAASVQHRGNLVVAVSNSHATNDLQRLHGRGRFRCGTWSFHPE